MRSHAACGLSASIQRLSISDLLRVKDATVCVWCLSCYVQTKEFTGRDDSSDGWAARNSCSVECRHYGAHFSYRIHSAARYHSHGERERERATLKWASGKGTGARLYHYHQYGDEVDLAQLWSSEQELAVKTAGNRRDCMEKVAGDHSSDSKLKKKACRDCGLGVVPVLVPLWSPFWAAPVSAVLLQTEIPDGSQAFKNGVFQADVCVCSVTLIGFGTRPWLVFVCRVNTGFPFGNK